MSDVTQRDIDRVIDRINSLEQKLWGLVAAVFLMVIGYLFQQLQAVREAPVPVSPETASNVLAAIWRTIGG